MAIYDLREHKTDSEENEEARNPSYSRKERFFAAIGGRCFFFMLFLGDLIWCGYAFSVFFIASLFWLMTLGKVAFLREYLMKACVSVRRALVCGMSLLIALCSPTFGIMVVYTYFLMYDKSGIDEVVPSSLQAQFKGLFKSS